MAGAGINRVVLIGRMTRDPELRTTASNYSVASFSVAIDRRVGQGKEPATDFIPCTVWGTQAENVARYTHKGSLVGIEGRIQSRSYQDKQGNNRTAVEVVADSVQFLEPRGASQQQTSSYRPQTSAPAAPVMDYQDDYSDAQPLDISADDLPF